MSKYRTAEDFDWFKHYPAAFATTTAHLSHVELGVYRRLLDHYWSADNQLPRDAEQIAERIGEKVINWRRYGITAPAGFDNEEITIKIVEYLLLEFFDQDEDGNWRHLWLDDYRKAADEQFQERSKASRERATRQPRGQRGKFSKATTDQSPCPTADSTVPDGDSTVKQSRDRGTKHEEMEEMEKTDKMESPSGHNLEETPAHEDRSPAPEFPDDILLPDGEERSKRTREFKAESSAKALRYIKACSAKYPLAA